MHLNLAYCSQSTPLSPCNHKNINCRSDWRDQGRIERGTPTPGRLWMWKNCTDIYCEKDMLNFENFWKCTPEMYLFRFVNTPLGVGRQHRRLPRAANTLAPPLLVINVYTVLLTLMSYTPLRYVRNVAKRSKNTRRAPPNAERQHIRTAEWFLQRKWAMQLWSGSTIWVLFR